jgi:hypothetical protein
MKMDGRMWVQLRAGSTNRPFGKPTRRWGGTECLSTRRLLCKEFPSSLKRAGHVNGALDGDKRLRGPLTLSSAPDSSDCLAESACSVPANHKSTSQQETERNKNAVRSTVAPVWRDFFTPHAGNRALELPYSPRIGWYNSKYVSDTV